MRDKLDVSHLQAQVVPYSSVVGSGIMLLDEAGRCRGQLALLNIDLGMTKEAHIAVSEMVALAINQKFERTQALNELADMGQEFDNAPDHTQEGG